MLDPLRPDKNNIEDFKEKNYITQKFLYYLFAIFIIIGIGATYIGIPVFFDNLIFNNSTQSVVSDDSEGAKQDSSDCTVKGIEVHGTLITYIPFHSEADSSFNYDVTSSESVDSLIKDANKDENIKAILLEVDSPGGSPVAGEEISNAVKNSQKLVVALIRENGDSAAYWAASGAERIFASLNSNVGSIGVTSSYLSNVDKNRKEGYQYEQIIAGKYKDSGSPDKPLSKEEKDLFLRDVNIVFDNFIYAVATNRHLAVDDVRAMADGSTMLGSMAKDRGLVDEIGGIDEVTKYLEKKIGGEAKICW